MCLVVSSLLCDDIDQLLDCVVSLFELERRSLSLQGLLRLLLFLHQTAVYVESSLITHQTRVMTTVLAPLLADCAMDASRDILLVDVASLLALHSPLFFPLETAPPSPLSSLAVEQIHGIAQRHVTEFAACVIDLEKLAKEDAFECVYRGDVRFVAETHIRDTPENLEIFSKFLEAITDDAVASCDVCKDGCTVSSLALNFACFSDNAIDATFQSDDLSFSEISRFFLRFYRLHARLEGKTSLMRLQRLAALLTQRLFLQTDADFASELSREEVGHFIRETPLCAVEEVAGDGREMGRRLSVDATAELPVLPVVQVAGSVSVSGAGSMNGGVMNGGVSNGVSNGVMSNGVSNGVMSNGVMSNGVMSNGVMSNGMVNTMNTGSLNTQVVAGSASGVVSNQVSAVGSMNGVLMHAPFSSGFGDTGVPANPAPNALPNNPITQTILTNGLASNPINNALPNNPINQATLNNPINQATLTNPTLSQASPPSLPNVPLVSVKSGPIPSLPVATPIPAIPAIIARADSYASPPPLPRGFLPTATPVPLARATSIPAVPLQSVPSLPIDRIPAGISIPLSPLPSFPSFPHPNETPSPGNPPVEDPFPRFSGYLRDYVSRGIPVASLQTNLQVAETPSFIAESFLAATGVSASLDFFYVVSGSAVAPAEKCHILALLQLLTETPLENRLFACVTALEKTAGVVTTQDFVAFIPAFSRLISAVLPVFVDRFQRNAFDPQGFLKQQIPAISAIPAGNAATLLRRTLEGIETVLQTSETPLPRDLKGWETTLGVRNVSPAVLREKLLGHEGNESDWLTRLEFRGEVADWLEASGAPATPISAGFADMVFAREKEGSLLRVRVSRGIEE